jgi:RimJ/RimL family protein N-acetyltransferase
MSIRKNTFGQPIGETVLGWAPRQRPSRRALLGRYCRIDPVSVRDHAEDLYAAYVEAADARDWTYLPVQLPGSLEGFREYLAELARSDDPLHFAIVDLATDKAVGTSAFMRIDGAHGVIEVGHINFSRRMKRSRVGTEAMFLLMRLVFDDLGYRRFEWKCDSLNAASRTAAERLGFSFEGIFRWATLYKGRSRDTAWYSLIGSEWPPIRAAFEAWLSPDNFDSQGVQKKSLRSLRGE